MTAGHRTITVTPKGWEYASTMKTKEQLDMIEEMHQWSASHKELIDIARRLLRERDEARAIAAEVAQELLDANYNYPDGFNWRDLIDWAQRLS